MVLCRHFHCPEMHSLLEMEEGECVVEGVRAGKERKKISFPTDSNISLCIPCVKEEMRKCLVFHSKSQHFCVRILWRG